MRTDNAIRFKAIDVLLANLGELDADRFISMIKRDAFDYTEWQRGLFENQTIDEIHAAATEYERSQI